MSYAHPTSSASPHLSTAYPHPFSASSSSSSLHPSLFDVSSPLLYPPTPLRDSSGSASLFSHPDEPPPPPSSLSAYLSSLSSSPSLPHHHPHHPSHPSYPSSSSDAYDPSSSYPPYPIPSHLPHPPHSLAWSKPPPTSSKDSTPLPPSPLSSASAGGSSHDLFHSEPHSSTSPSSPSPSPPHPPSPSPHQSNTSHPSPSSPSPHPHPPSSSASLQPPSSSLLPPRKRKGHLHNRKVACNVCHLAKTSCDGVRPCSRCVRLNKVGLCVDRPSKVARVVEAGMGGVGVGMGVPVWHVPVPAAVVGGGGGGGGQQGAGVGGAEAEGAAGKAKGKADEKDGGGVGVEVADDSDSSAESVRSEGDGDVESEDSDGGSVDDCPLPCYAEAEDGEGADEQLSRALLNSHLSWGERQRRQNPSMTGMRKMDLREKLIYYTWLCSMMKPQHVEELMHQSSKLDKAAPWDDKVKEMRRAWAEQLRKQQHTQPVEERKDAAADSTDSGVDERVPGDSSSSSASSTSSPRAKWVPYRPCDGRVCNNFCPAARQWAAANPCSITWHLSPEAALVSPLNEYAGMTIRDLSDARVCGVQNVSIIANLFQMRADEKKAERSMRTESGGGGGVGGGSAAAAAAVAAAEEGGEEINVCDLGSYQQLFHECMECGVLSQGDEQAIRIARQRQASRREPSTTSPVSSPTQLPSRSTALSLSSSSSSSSSSSPSSPYPLPIPATHIEVPMWCQVNTAFERLTGYSQAELRQLLLRDGVKSLYRLTRPDEWEKLMELEQEATWGKAHEYRTYAVIVNKYQGEVSCLIHTLYVFNDTGKFSETRTTFIPLPNARPPASMRDSSGGGRREREDRRHGKRRGKDKERSAARSTSKGRRKDER